MNTAIRMNTWGMLVVGILLSACSPNDPVEATQASSSPATTATRVSAPPTDDPCMLLTEAEVGAVFAQTASAKRNHSLDDQGIQTCQWTMPASRLAVQLIAGDGSSVERELRSRADGFVDPLMPGAKDHVRYETLANVGNQTMLVVEKADPSRGILNDAAVLVTQKGKRVAIVFTDALPGDRASAVKALGELGRRVADRL